MEIIPSPLEKNSDDLIKQLKRLSPYFKSFQIDIADGIYVPNKTVQIDEILLAIKQFNNETIKTLSFDFHLMVKDYEQSIKQLNNLTIKNKSFRIQTIFIHYSLHPNYHLLTVNFPQFHFALVLNPEDSVSDLTNNYQLTTINSIQIMSVHPGFQGSPFLPETLKKIEQLRQKDYRNTIYLDGAVNQETLPIILTQKFKPDVICPGSFLTKTDHLQDHVDYLRTAIKSA